jgi:hypothetical protein
MHEISIEMCELVDQQSELLNSRPTLNALSAEEIEAYAYRNNRISQLSKELGEM